MAVDPHGGNRLNMIGISLTPHQAVGSLATVFHNRNAIPWIEELEPARFTPLAYVTASPDWQHFAGITRGLNTLGIFHAHSGRTRILEEGTAQWSTHVAWSNDGHILATGRNPDFRETLRLEEKLYASPPNSPDGLRVALNNARAPTLILWDPVTAQKLSSIPAGTLAAGNGRTCDVGAFSPDDRFLVTHARRSGTPARPGYFQLWDVSSVRHILHGAE